MSTSLINRRQDKYVTVLFACFAPHTPVCRYSIDPIYLNADNVQVFCQHKDGRLTGQMHLLKNFGRESAAAAAAAATEKGDCMP